MALLSVIRRWHFREQLSIRAIARRTSLSRNTIRKYLRSEAVEPVFRTPDRPSKLDPYKPYLVERSHLIAAVPARPSTWRRRRRTTLTAVA